MQDSQFFRRAQTVAFNVLGPNMVLIDSYAIKKCPAQSADNSGLPWHQDQAYWEPGVIYHACTFSLSLQEVTPEMGCVQFLPHSNLGNLLPHQKVGPAVCLLELSEDILTETGIYVGDDY